MHKEDLPKPAFSFLWQQAFNRFILRGLGKNSLGWSSPFINDVSMVCIFLMSSD